MFANPLGLLALLAAPAVLALHLYRRRFEPRAVSGLFLWAPEDRTPVAGRKREPLRTNASLWCELACAVLLALAFSGPRAACSSARGEHLVVVLDGSASMAARDGGEATRDRVREELRGRVEALPRGSRVTLVASGRRPRVLAGPGAFPAQALAALDEWTPTAARHDLAPAVAMAAQFAGDAKLALYTDHFDPERWPTTVELASFGRPVDNWALTHATRTRERSADGAELDRVFLTVASFAAGARSFDLRIVSAGAELARERVELAAGARTHLALSIPSDAGTLEIALEPDGLEIDDVALLAPPVARTLALFSDLDEAELHTLGLSSPGERNIGRWLALTPRSVEADSASTAHLVLTHGAPLEGAAWALEFTPLGDARRDVLGPFLVDRADALLEGATLEGVVWSLDPKLELAGAPLVSVGTTPLLTESTSAGRVTWRMNLDPARSSLQRSPDWPILLANFAEARRAALPGPERTNLALGERFVLRPGDAAASFDRSAPLPFVIEGPLGSPKSSRSEVPARDRLELDVVDALGAFRVWLGERQVADYAVSFLDASESDLRAARPGRRESSLETGAVEGELSWIELLALVGALAAACLDWWFLARGPSGAAPRM